jgi:hypothetical protein
VAGPAVLLPLTSSLDRWHLAGIHQHTALQEPQRTELGPMSTPHPGGIAGLGHRLSLQAVSLPYPAPGPALPFQPAIRLPGSAAGCPKPIWTVTPGGTDILTPDRIRPARELGVRRLLHATPVSADAVTHQAATVGGDAICGP